MWTSESRQTAGIGAWQPFGRVLVAAALGPAGATAVRRAARLPLGPGARVTVLHVATPPGSFVTHGDTARAATPVVEALAAEGEEVARAAGCAEPEVVPRLAEGTPSTEIIRAAWEERAEIVVVGAPAGRLYGSAGGTIARVIRHAGLPLLVARTDPERRYRHVLCAVDRSVAAVDTVALAVRLARPTAAGFTLLHAYHVPFEPMLHDEAEAEGEALAHVRALARSMRGAAPVRMLVRHGEPGIEMVRTAARERTAEWVIASAPCDVAVTRPHRLVLERR
jgi:nucleotide-binding universal stress UspA family protein